MKAYQLADYVSFELGMLGRYKYYTGVIVKAYTYGTGELIVTGGRYDSLLKQFGKQAASIGFAINVDQLLIALSRQKLLPEVEKTGIVVLCEPDCQAAGASIADALRRQGKIVELMHRREEKEVFCYLEYAAQNHRAEMQYITTGGTAVYTLV